MTNINENNSTTDNTQSHWGSGVKFENIQIGPYTAPPPNNSTAVRQGKSKVLSSWLVFLAAASLLLSAMYCVVSPYVMAARLAHYDKVSFGKQSPAIGFYWGKRVVPLSVAGTDKSGFRRYEAKKPDKIDVSRSLLPYLFVNADKQYSKNIANINFDNSVVGQFVPLNDSSRESEDVFNRFLESDGLPDTRLRHSVNPVRDGLKFFACSFKNTVFVDTEIDPFENCDFSGAVFAKNCYLKLFHKKQLVQTANYKKYKDFSTCTFGGGDYTDTDFSGFKFIKSVFVGCRMVGCNFSGADLRGLRTICIDMDTTEFRHRIDEGGVDRNGDEVPDKYNPDKRLSLLENVDFEGANFTDADISYADFGPTRTRHGHDPWSCNITLEQVKQTKNYKEGKMDGIKLPPDVQKALDEEMKQKDAEKEK